MFRDIITYFIFGFYILALLFVTLYCFVQFHLLLKYRLSRKRLSMGVVVPKTWPGDLPMVTIQLPVYNECYVIEQLIDNIVNLNYPVDKLEIQVLDDSTDSTANLCRQKVAYYKSRGMDIRLLHRSVREGYKAGALSEGLCMAKGEFIAIFDADFLPGPDFIMQTLPHFSDRTVGVVQTKWDHINKDYSLITKLQAFQLNVHFTIEQTGRQEGDYLLQFNGTAGIWRRKAIEDAGGWNADTLTEDLDLSYRAQLKGWKIIYRQDIGSPAELPSEMIGLKSQQFRWMKGGAENARKLIPRILRSNIPLNKKFHAVSHLLSGTVFLFIFILGVLSVPVLVLTNTLSLPTPLYWICFLGFLAAGCVYFAGNRDATWIDKPMYYKVITFVFIFPAFLSLSMGLSLHNSIAVIQGYCGRKSEFIRTPKFNIQQIPGNIKKDAYRSNKISITMILEGLMACYFLIAVMVGIQMEKWTFIVYHLILMMGFGSIFFYSIKHLRFR